MSETPFQPCVACGWTLQQQDECCYSSHVKLLHSGGQHGVWSIGSDAILKERPDEGPKTEVKTLNYLSAYPDIPAPKVMDEWVDGNGRHFVLQERIKGQTLEQAWPSLSASQKTYIADQVVAVRTKLRSLTSKSMQTVDQGPLYPDLLLADDMPLGRFGHDSVPHGPFNSDLELWNAIDLTLRKPPSEQGLEHFKNRFPKCEPYVLTHCDLNLSNIIVRYGEVVGILDWEYAGYYPIWYEYVSASWAWTEEDKEWKELLQERMEANGDGHRDAERFLVDIRRLRMLDNWHERKLQKTKVSDD